jgi:hypothetical protein
MATATIRPDSAQPATSPSATAPAASSALDHDIRLFTHLRRAAVRARPHSTEHARHWSDWDICIRSCSALKSAAVLQPQQTHSVRHVHQSRQRSRNMQSLQILYP